MKKTILVDGMFCIYDKEFNVNKELLKIINSFNARKILVVNGFREKGKQALIGSDFLAFSLEEEKIKKDNPEYFKTLLSRYDLKIYEVLYFDHDENNVKTAKSLGIVSTQYLNNEQIEEFLKIKIGLN